MKYIVIGTGNISRTYIQAIGNLPGSSLCGFISRSGRSPESAPDFPVWKSLDEVDCEYDCVIITTPNKFHHIHAVDAAERGKHVLCEKPLDITREGMDLMIDACRKAGVTLSASYQRRMSPDNLSLKKLMDENKLGRVFAADLSCKFWRDQEYYDSAPYRGGYDIDGGGPFMQQAVHNLDFYQWIFGMPVEVKSMTGRFMHEMEVEDHGAALLRHENGMIGTVIASTAATPGFMARLEVHSDRGYFITVDDRITEWGIAGVPNPAAALPDALESGSNQAFINDSSRHEAVLLDFEEAVREKREPMITAESARRTTELVLMIYKAAV